MNYEGDRRNLNLVAVGDALIQRPLSIFDEEPYMALIEIIRSGDVSFANMEVLIHELDGYPAEYAGGTHIAVPPRVARELQWAGFNLFSRANNHAMDYSHGGMSATSKHMDALGLVHSGVGENAARARAAAYLDTKGARTALVSVSATCPPGSRAGEQRPDVQGRPGVNALRHSKKYVVPVNEIDSLRRIGRQIGWEDWKDQLVERGARGKEGPTEYELLGKSFVAGEHPGTVSIPHKGDMDRILAEVDAAARQADFVLVSIHSHENDGDLEKPSQFIQEFCRKSIEAGAHAVIGHGPHVLQGIELHQGYPIFYSLGNFLYQTPTQDFLPADVYTKFGLDEFRGKPADVFDVRIGGDALRRDRRWWEGALAQCRFEGGKLSEIRLVPVDLGQQSSRSQQGRPFIAQGATARKIIEDLIRLSAPFGTEIVFSDGMGRVKL